MDLRFAGVRFIALVYRLHGNFKVWVPSLEIFEYHSILEHKCSFAYSLRVENPGSPLDHYAVIVERVHWITSVYGQRDSGVIGDVFNLLRVGGGDQIETQSVWAENVKHRGYMRLRRLRFCVHRAKVGEPHLGEEVLDLSG